jgi:hypothetical protein
MSDARPASGFGPCVLELTEDEARIAGARAGLRRALAGRLTLGHLAPLAAFVLAMTFIAILTLTGLVARRHGEIGLLTAAAAFMIQRLATRRRFFRSRRASLAEIETMRAAGPQALGVDDAGVNLGAAKRWNFVDCLEVEDAGGLIYLWPHSGPPAVLPVRAFADPEEAARFVEFLRARLLRQLAQSPAAR